jgi:hypothetical protein
MDTKKGTVMVPAITVPSRAVFAFLVPSPVKAVNQPKRLVDNG